MLSRRIGGAGVEPALKAALGCEFNAGSISSLCSGVFEQSHGIRFLFSNDGEYFEEVNAWQLHVAGSTDSAATRATRSSALKAVLRWFEEHDLRWQECTELAHINLMRQYYRGVAPLSPVERAAGVPERTPKVKKTTWNQWMVHWWAFLRHAKRKKWIEDIGFELWQAKQRGKSDPMIRALGPEEFRRFMAAAPTQRLRAGLSSFLGTGLRAAELAALRDSDVPHPNEYGGDSYRPRSILGKGKKEREIFWPLAAAKAAHAYRIGERRLAVETLKAAVRSGKIAVEQTYLERSDPQKPNSPLIEKADAPLWLTEDGWPLSYKRWGREFTELSKASGVRATPHWLRHSYAIVTLSMLIKQQIKQEIIDSKLGTSGHQKYFRDPVDEVRKRLGHASIETTMVYLDHIAEHRHLIGLAIADLEAMYLDE